MIHLLVLLLSVASSTPDSAVLSEANRKLSERDTLGAIDVLQDWTQGHTGTPAVTDLLDFLQLPELNAIRAPESPQPAVVGAQRHLWSVRAQGEFRPDRELPALGEVDLWRRVPLSTSEGATELLAGLTAGSWLEGADPYSDVDLWTSIEFHRANWKARLEGWGGWTDRNQPEAGVSVLLESKGRLGDWEFREGPMARLSWQRTRLLGWYGFGSRPGGSGVIDLDGSVRLRQDPSWPLMLGFDSLPVRFARVRLQSTLHSAWTRSKGSIRFGPQIDLDGRISLSPDRWADTLVARSERRSELGCMAGGFLRWDPTPAWSTQGELGWTLAATAGEAGMDLSPFREGPFLRLSAFSNF